VSDDPTDAAIEETLRAAPADRWQGLWEAVDALLAEDERAVWAGGELVETTVVGGVERPVFQMPYVTYSDAMNRVVQSLYDLDAVVPLNWPEWDGVDRYRGHRALEHASVANAVRMMTAIVRADRFSEGMIAAMLEDGTLPAALRRLRRWYHRTNSRGSPYSRLY
jgi:hypothetical protein